jgi:hypothetical protein
MNCRFSFWEEIILIYVAPLHSKTSFRGLCLSEICTKVFFTRIPEKLNKNCPMPSKQIRQASPCWERRKLSNKFLRSGAAAGQAASPPPPTAGRLLHILTNVSHNVRFAESCSLHFSGQKEKMSSYLSLNGDCFRQAEKNTHKNPNWK